MISEAKLGLIEGRGYASSDETKDLILEIRRLSRQSNVLAIILAQYANRDRDSVPNVSFYGNDARFALAEYLGVEVLDLEPKSGSARNIFEELLGVGGEKERLLRVARAAVKLRADECIGAVEYKLIETFDKELEAVQDLLGEG